MLVVKVGRENPSELKAQKLARSVTRGLVDRDLKPDVEEKRQIDAILLYPPNRYRPEMPVWLPIVCSASSPRHTLVCSVCSSLTTMILHTRGLLQLLLRPAKQAVARQ